MIIAVLPSSDTCSVKEAMNFESTEFDGDASNRPLTFLSLPLHPQPEPPINSHISWEVGQHFENFLDGELSSGTSVNTAAPTCIINPPQATPAGTGPELPPRIAIPEDEFNRVIRKRRKVRDRTACHVCHRRRIKCNRELPCDKCVSRDHPELCCYGRPTEHDLTVPDFQFLQKDSSETKGSVQSGPMMIVRKEEWDSMQMELQRRGNQIEALEVSFSMVSNELIWQQGVGYHL